MTDGRIVRRPWLLQDVPKGFAAGKTRRDKEKTKENACHDLYGPRLTFFVKKNITICHNTG
jgi:hypothetical protein